MIKSSDGGTYDWVKVVVDGCGDGAQITYRCTELNKDGSDSLDDDCSQWTDDEVREQTCAMLDIVEGMSEIQVEFD